MMRMGRGWRNAHGSAAACSSGHGGRIRRHLAHQEAATMRAHRSQARAESSRPPSGRPRAGRRAAEPRGEPPGASTGVLLRELVAHLRQRRTRLRDEWAERIIQARLLTAMSRTEIFAEATSVYDNYLDALETGT